MVDVSLSHQLSGAANLIMNFSDLSDFGKSHGTHAKGCDVIGKEETGNVPWRAERFEKHPSPRYPI